MGWVIWAIVTVGFFAIWEYIGLVNREDNRQPLTFFIRKMVGTPNNPVFWVGAAIVLWFLYHIFIVHDGP